MIKKTSLAIFFLWSLINYGQMSEKSPYSFFGIGSETTQNTISSLGMGGVTISIDENYELNFSNPALLSGIKLTSFDLGGQSRFLKISDANDQQSSSNTTLSYLALGFPIYKNLGFMVGLQPNSNVGYYLTDEIRYNDDTLKEVSIYEGEGGTNRMVFGLGYEIYKGLSVGVETEFLFGNINKNIINQKDGIALHTRYDLNSELRGKALKFGLSYKDSISDQFVVKAEASTTLSNEITSTNDEYLYSFYNSSNGREIPQDTLVANHEIDRKIKRPALFHSGVGLGQPGKWFAGLDYTTQKAWTYPTGLLENSKVQYSTKSKFALGGYYIPKANSVTSYWNRVVYRAGLRYEKPGLSIKGTENNSDFIPLKDFGMSFGLGLPMGNQLSRLNLGVELGQRGSTIDGLIKENYINLRVGLNIAEKWFNKRMID